jgi:hypothetical protein
VSTLLLDVLKSINHAYYARDSHSVVVRLFSGLKSQKIAAQKPDISPRFVLPAIKEIVR